jgi:hypothetical protein
LPQPCRRTSEHKNRALTLQVAQAYNAALSSALSLTVCFCLLLHMLSPPPTHTPPPPWSCRKTSQAPHCAAEVPQTPQRTGPWPSRWHRPITQQSTQKTRCWCSGPTCCQGVQGATTHSSLATASPHQASCVQGRCAVSMCSVIVQRQWAASLCSVIVQRQWAASMCPPQNTLRALVAHHLSRYPLLVSNCVRSDSQRWCGTPSGPVGVQVMHGTQA